jgi:hypothetical protein
MLGFDSQELPKSNKKGKIHSTRKGNITENNVNNCQSIPPSPQGTRVSLFIGEDKGLTIMPQLPLTTYPTNRVCDQGGGGNPVYYIKTPLYNASNETLTRAGSDTAVFR